MTNRPVIGYLVEIVETLVLTLIIFVVIQNFVAQPYQVQLKSMQHTLEPEQYVLVDKLTPRFDPYKRGDVVVFTPPGDWVDSQGTPYIKRVIGVPGDTVEIRDDGLVYIDDWALEEPYVYNDDGGPAHATTAPSEQARWTIAEGEVFLMGDHRSSSADSREFGPVETDQVIGRAWLRYWPIDTFGILPTPTYLDLVPATP